MADQPEKPAVQKKEGRGFGRDKKPEKGKGGPRRDGKKDQEAQWKPVTKLGRLVKYGHIKDLADIFRFSIPIKES